MRASARILGGLLALHLGVGPRDLLPGDPGQTIFAYTAEPNSPSQDALNLLTSWASTPANQESSVQAEREG